VNDVNVVSVFSYILGIEQWRKHMNRIKEVREQKGITQYELGRLLEKYQSWVWQVENGYCEPKGWEKEAIAKALCADVSEIFPGKTP